MACLRPALPLLLTLAGSLAGVRADSPSPAVDDQAGLLDQESIRLIERQLAILEQRYGATVVVETVPAPPEAVVRKAKGFFRFRSLARLLARWAAERGRESGADVYLLISREPPRSWVYVSPQAQESLLAERDRHRLVRALNLAVERREFAGGLLQALVSLQERLDARLQDYARGPAVWLPVLWTALTILGCWVLLLLARLRLQRGAPPRERARSLLDQPNNGPSSGLLGGTCGAIAGQFLYESLRAPSRLSAPSAAPTIVGPPVPEDWPGMNGEPESPGSGPQAPDDPGNAGLDEARDQLHRPPGEFHDRTGMFLL